MGAFRLDGMGVIAKPDQIIIMDVENEAAAHNVMDWILIILKNMKGKNWPEGKVFYKYVIL